MAKIRNGFVSNSSSSSFLIYGAQFKGYSEDKLKEYANKYDHSFPEEVTSILREYDIEVEYGPDCDEAYLGVSWSDIKDDETGAEFKTRIENAIKKAFPDIEWEFGTFSEAWYDG